MRAATDGASLAHLKRALGFVPSYIEAYLQSGSQAVRLLKDDFRALFGDRDDWRVLLNQFDVPRQLSGRAPLNQSLYLWSRTMLANYVLTVLSDRMEMSHSVEGRLPFLDHELVECVARLPVGLKIRDDLTEKYVLREAARPYIPDAVYRRQKHPFMAPPAATAPESALFQLFQDAFRSSAFVENPFYDQAKVIDMLDRVPIMPRDERIAVDRDLTAMLSFVLLQDKLGLSA